MARPDPSPFFTWDAADYHKNSPAQRQWGRELIEKLCLSGSERVLDIGCGDGTVTAEIARNLPEGKVTGVDNSSEMIRFACDNFLPAEHRNLSFIRMDARALTFREEFDVVFSNAALHWITDHTPVFAGINRGLRPGGRLLIQMSGKGNAEQVFNALDSMLGKPRWKPFFDDFFFMYSFFDSSEYQQRLTEAGFELVQAILIPRDMVIPTREDFAAWIRTTWLPWTSRLPESERPDFISSLIDEYLIKNPVGNDGIIHIRMNRLEARAKKKG